MFDIGHEYNLLAITEQSNHLATRNRIEKQPMVRKGINDHEAPAACGIEATKVIVSQQGETGVPGCVAAMDRSEREGNRSLGECVSRRWVHTL